MGEGSTVSTQQLLQAVIAALPPVEFAFAYGSGAVAQLDYSAKEKPMIDFIFAVDDAECWHAQNLKRNPSHYSSLKFLGPKYIACLQDNYGGQIYYNTLVPFADRLIKYGVISTKNLQSDLSDWTTLYVGGRLHKPVVTLVPCQKLQPYLSLNLRHAVAVALLLLPQSFTAEELYETISSLSYMGDVRMGLAENPQKVNNIVKANLPGFASLYKAPLLDLSPFVKPVGADLFEQADSPAAKSSLFSMCPSSLRAACPVSTPSPKDVRVALSQIVKASSRTQTIKGLISGGVRKSSSYLLAKLLKRWR